MEKISKKQYHELVRPIYEKVFNESGTCYDIPFSNQIKNKYILHKCVYELPESLLRSLIYTAQQVGDKGAYVSVITNEETESEVHTYHWYVDFSELHQSGYLAGPTMYVIFSPSGKWGVIFSFDQFALLGCNDEFAQIIEKTYPQIRTEVYDFLSYWKDYEKEVYVCTTWIPQLLYHLYGKKRGKQLMSENGSNFEQIES